MQETVDLEVTHVLLVRDNVASQMQGSDLVQVHLQSLETTTTMCGDKVARKPVLVNVARETIRVRKQKFIKECHPLHFKNHFYIDK